MEGEGSSGPFKLASWATHAHHSHIVSAKQKAKAKKTVSRAKPKRTVTGQARGLATEAKPEETCHRS
eukprot:1142516-Pelagomonas_calceolata.AAC.3